MMPHGHVDLAALTERLGLGALFDTAVVFENFPAADPGAARNLPGLRVESATTESAGHHPLSLMVLPRDGGTDVNLLHRSGAATPSRPVPSWTASSPSCAPSWPTRTPRSPASPAPVAPPRRPPDPGWPP